MRRTTKIALFICASGLLAASAWWCFYSSYIKPIKNLPKEITAENYYQFLDALSRLPDTQALLRSYPYPRILTDGRTDARRVPDGIEAHTLFAHLANFRDTKEASSETLLILPQPEDFSKAFLLAEARAQGSIVINVRIPAYMQFVLYDVAGRVLLGPKAPVTKQGVSIPLFVRPTADAPIPTGFADPQFDATHVAKVAVRFVLRMPNKENATYYEGKYSIHRLIVIKNISMLQHFFPVPDATRITQDGLNLKYELHKRAWTKTPSDFFVGVNYPWRNYGWDFGKSPKGVSPLRDGWALHEEELTRNFMSLREIGVTHVRMYVFCDLRTGLIVSEKGEYAFDPFVLEDAEAVLRAAEKTKIKLIFVLFDFGIGNTAGAEYASPGRPELIFSGKKHPFLIQAVLPFLRALDALNDKHGKPVSYLELMNEPDNLALLVVPGYYEALVSWFQDLAAIIHNETSFEVTIGSGTLGGLVRWWKDVPVDTYQFHFYENMRGEMPPVPTDTPRKAIMLDGAIFCGELDPYHMAENILRLKEQGYTGVLLWSYKAGDGFDIDLDALRDTIQNLKKESEKKENKK